ASPLRVRLLLPPFLHFLFRRLPPAPGSTLFPYTTLFRSRWPEDRIRRGETPYAGRRARSPPRRARSPSTATTAARCRTPVHPHRSEEHTSELQSLAYLVCRLLLEKKNHL